jgi:hypothetical protein
MNKNQYKKYLSTPEWKGISDFVKSRDEYKCKLCNTQHDLEVHHRSYQWIGKEKGHEVDLVTLCKRCHGMFHSKGISTDEMLPKIKRSIRDKDFENLKIEIENLKRTNEVMRGNENAHCLPQNPIKIPDENEIILDSELINNLTTDKGGITGATMNCFKEAGINTKHKGWKHRAEGLVVSREWYIRAEKGRHLYTKSTIKRKRKQKK